MNPTLANAELAVMDLLWERAEAMTAREIRERDPDGKKTTARNGSAIIAVGWKKRDCRKGPEYFSSYSTAISRESDAGGELESLGHKLTAGSFVRESPNGRTQKTHPKNWNKIQHPAIASGWLRNVTAAQQSNARTKGKVGRD